jgi:ElaB/YqjD/DUF883 family membrane-anchored ribosome-binding protein
MGASNVKLVEELQAVMAEFEVLAKAALGAAGDQAGDAAADLSRGLSQARERLAAFEQDMGQQLKHHAHKADSYAHERPWLAIGIAAAAAFLLGIVVARRDRT